MGRNLTQQQLTLSVDAERRFPALGATGVYSQYRSCREDYRKAFPIQREPERPAQHTKVLCWCLKKSATTDNERPGPGDNGPF